MEGKSHDTLGWSGLRQAPTSLGQVLYDAFASDASEGNAIQDMGRHLYDWQNGETIKSFTPSHQPHGMATEAAFLDRLLYSAGPTQDSFQRRGFISAQASCRAALNVTGIFSCGVWPGQQLLHIKAKPLS